MVGENDTEENGRIFIFSRLLTKSFVNFVASKIIRSKSGDEKNMLC
jgi:hypothetical protein